jgi:type IV fimbrial biogenesis protein FimT
MTFMSEVCNTLTMDKEPGFTLVELLITIVVATILLAVGVPAFQSFIKNNRVTAQANDLVSAIQLARSEAVKRGTVATICASSDRATCNVTDKHWERGWIVFSDLNRDGAPNKEDGSTPITGTCLSTEDCILRTNGGLSGKNTVTANVNGIRYQINGFANENDIPSVGTVKKAVFTLKADNCEHNQARDITVTQQGHTSVTTIPCS